MTNPRMLDRRKFWLCALLAACSILSPGYSQLVPGTMDVHWNEGSEDCVKNPQPPIQVHRYNAQTFILRENLCATYEAPFIYLLIGKNRAPHPDSSWGWGGCFACGNTCDLAGTLALVAFAGGSEVSLRRKSGAGLLIAWRKA
jgi:hypothetical protein